MPGSVHRRTLKSGGVRYRAVYPLGRDPNTGKYRSRKEDFKRKGDAERRVAEWRLAAEAGTLASPSSETIAQAAERWLETFVTTRRPSTQVAYDYSVRRHIIPLLGRKKVFRFQQQDVLDWHRTMRRNGAGKATMLRAHTNLRQILVQCVELGIARTNAATLIKAPDYEPQSRAGQVWSATHARSFLDVADAHCRYGPIFRLSLDTGMRRGELLGLRWTDLDLADGALRIEQAYIALRGRLQKNPPKTPRSARVVELTEKTVEALRRHRDSQDTARKAAETWPADDLVFTTEAGKPVPPTSLYREYQRLIAMADIPRIRVHDHRHTHITWGIEAGLDARTIADRVGDSVAMILSTYTHVDRTRARAAADLIGRRLNHDAHFSHARTTSDGTIVPEDAPPEKDESPSA